MAFVSSCLFHFFFCLSSSEVLFISSAHVNPVFGFQKIVGFSISFLQKLPIKSLENRGHFMFEMKEKSCRHEMLRHNHSSRGLPYDGSQSIRVSCCPFLSPLSNML